MLDIKDIHHIPNLDEINDYIQNPLFLEFYNYLNHTYEPLCKIEYSKDSLLKGWNIKFRKAGKSLCVIYPKPNYITVLVVIGKKEKEATEHLLPQLTQAMQTLYETTNEGMGQRWLMIDLHTSDALYDDVKKFIHLRRTSR